MSKDLTKRQSEIIQAAIRLIGEGGIQALTIKNLSNEIGITESAIYRHFKSRTEIIDTLLNFLQSAITSHYYEVSEMIISAMERIKKMIAGQMRIFSENPPYAVVILSDGLYKNEKILHDKIYSVMENAKETYIRIINDGKKTGEIRTDISSDQIAFVIMGSVRLTINQWSLSNFTFDLQQRGELLFKTLKTLIQNP